MSYGALESKLEYPHILASKLSFFSFLASIIFLIRAIRKGKDWFSVFNHDELRGNELERLEDRFANDDHFAGFDSFFEFFGNVDLDNLASNWAYMVITSIAWNLKSWSALLTPVAPGQEQEHRAEKKRLLTMEFRTFLSVFIHVPCQILRHARKTIHRLLNWTDYTPAFFRLCAVLNL